MRVQDLQAHRKLDITRERISRILELRHVLATPNARKYCGDNVAKKNMNRFGRWKLVRGNSWNYAKHAWEHSGLLQTFKRESLTVLDLNFCAGNTPALCVPVTVSPYRFVALPSPSPSLTRTGTHTHTHIHTNARTHTYTQ